MNTTVVFVEQVLIGSMVLGIAALPMAPEISAFVASNDSSNLGLPGLSIAAVLVGLAYFLGVVFDRLSDTILATWEQHQRLRFALKDCAIFPAEGSDPFDEANMRIRVLKIGGSLAEWMNYLRTRVRLSRSLAIFLPGLTCAAQVALARTYCLGYPGKPSSPPTWCGPEIANIQSDLVADLFSPWIGVLVLGIYVALPALEFVLRVLARILDWLLANLSIDELFVGAWNPPKTYKHDKLKKYAKIRCLAGKGRDSWCVRLICRPVVRLLDSVAAPFFGFMAFAAAAITLASMTHTEILAWVAAVGIAVTALSIWAWSRMLDTFNIYLRETGKLPDDGEK